VLKFVAMKTMGAQPQYQTDVTASLPSAAALFSILNLSAARSEISVTVVVSNLWLDRNVANR